MLSHSAIPNLCDLMNRSPPVSSVHGILQARILECLAISFSRGSSGPRDQTLVSYIAGRFFTVWATREVHVHYTITKYHWLSGLNNWFCSPSSGGWAVQDQDTSIVSPLSWSHLNIMHSESLPLQMPSHWGLRLQFMDIIHHKGGFPWKYFKVDPVGLQTSCCYFCSSFWELE